SCAPTADFFRYTATYVGDGTSPPLTSDPAVVSVAITPYAGASSAGGILRIVGTAGADTITSGSGVLKYNGASISLSGISEIRIWGRGGADVIDLGGLSIRSFVHGGAGNDVITGGSADDVVLGGDGDDTITGSAG